MVQLEPLTAEVVAVANVLPSQCVTVANVLWQPNVPLWSRVLPVDERATGVKPREVPQGFNGHVYINNLVPEEKNKEHRARQALRPGIFLIAMRCCGGCRKQPTSCGEHEFNELVLLRLGR